MTLPPQLRTAICLLLVALLLPGMMELFETLEHLMHDGHLPHSAQHDQDMPGHESVEDVAALSDEHGCTAMTHSCGCHLSAPALLADEPIEDASLRLEVAESRPFIREQTPLSRANAPPTRPPIASV